MPSTFDDPTQPAHYRPSTGSLDYPPVNIEPHTVLLKDGQTTATIYPISDVSQVPAGLQAFLCDELNMEIERGVTLPFFETLHLDTFRNYWLGSFAAIMVIGDSPLTEEDRPWEKECLGTFFIKPNYPGRCSEICTGSFLVNAGIRGKGIGRTLAECFLNWAPRLGYTSCIFNLVYDTNLFARRIFETLNFKRIGRITGAGILKGYDNAVDGIIYGRELAHIADSSVGAYRFDKIKYYLETGTYPPMSNRQEKSRLRSSASHYTVEDGKLMLKGRIVIADPAEQLRIATKYHLNTHSGINKTTSAITERYHWTRIKDTVAIAIRSCQDCRDNIVKPSISFNRAIAKVKRGNLHHSSHDINLESFDMDSSKVHSLVAAAQLQGNHNTDSNFDLPIDDPILAAVEAAQRSNSSNEHYLKQSNQHDEDHQSHNVDTDNNQNDNQHRQANDDIPVDPQVESAFEEHVQAGDNEIEIARALLQANESAEPDHGNISEAGYI